MAIPWKHRLDHPAGHFPETSSAYRVFGTIPSYSLKMHPSHQRTWFSFLPNLCLTTLTAGVGM